MIMLFFILLFFNNIFAIRDPFYFGRVKQEANSLELTCKAIGNLNNNKFALIHYKGKNLTVKIGDKFDDKFITFIGDNYIIIKGLSGDIQKVFLE